MLCTGSGEFLLEVLHFDIKHLIIYNKVKISSMNTLEPEIICLWDYLYCNNTLKHLPERVASRDIHSTFIMETF